MDVRPLVPEESHGLHAVGCNVQVDELIGIAEGFLCQPDITRTVFYQENLYGHTFSSDSFDGVFSLSPKTKEKVEPWPTRDSTEIPPPCRSTIFLQIANPTPVPSNSSRLCNRWNMPKIFSKYCASIPSPLSSTENIHFFWPFIEAEMCTRGTPGPWYLMALPTRY